MMFGFLRSSSKEQTPQKHVFNSSSNNLLDCKQSFLTKKKQWDFDEFDCVQERPRLRRAHEEPNWGGRKQSKQSREEAQHVLSLGDQMSSRKAKQLQDRLRRQKQFEKLQIQMLETVMAMDNRQKKSTHTRPSVAETTSHEQNFSMEKPVVQKSESAQNIPLHKGMIETSDSDIFANENFVFYDRTTDAKDVHILFDEEAENNSEEEERVSYSLPIFDVYEDEMFECMTSCEDKCDLPSSEFYYVLENKQSCEELTCLQPELPSSIDFIQQVQEEHSAKKTHKSLPQKYVFEQPTSHEPERILKSFSYDFQEHCKELDLVRKNHNLFVLISAHEEKHFGLENVEEFCVSGSVFDQMIQSFETLKPENLFMPKCVFLGEFRGLDYPIEIALSEKTFEPFRAKTEFSFTGNLLKFKTFQKQFGFENLKDFSNAKLVFGSGIHSFQVFELKKFFMQARFPLDEKCDSNLVLRSFEETCEVFCCEDFWFLKFCEKGFKLKKIVFVESFSKLDQLLMFSETVFPKFRTFYEMHESSCGMRELWFIKWRERHLFRTRRCPESQDDQNISHLAQFNLLVCIDTSLIAMCSKEVVCVNVCPNVMDVYENDLDDDPRNLSLVRDVLTPEKLLVYSCCTFDVVSLVFVKEQDKQVKESDPRARLIQRFEKQVDYGPRGNLTKGWIHKRARTGRSPQSYQFADWIWKLLSTIQGSPISKPYFINLPMINCLFLSFVSDSFPFDVGKTDLRTNLFQEGGNDRKLASDTKTDTPRMEHVRVEANPTEQMEVEGHFYRIKGHNKHVCSRQNALRGRSSMRFCLMTELFMKWSKSFSRA